MDDRFGMYAGRYIGFVISERGNISHVLDDTLRVWIVSGIYRIQHHAVRTHDRQRARPARLGVGQNPARVSVLIRSTWPGAQSAWSLTFTR